LTGLVWLKNANCIQTYYPNFDQDGEQGQGAVTWYRALDFVAGINSGAYPACGAPYTDWRLPNVNELESLAHAAEWSSSQWLSTRGFANSDYWPGLFYWSSNGYPTGSALYVSMRRGEIVMSATSDPNFVWPVRSGTSPSTIKLAKTGQTESYYAGDDGQIGVGIEWPAQRFTVDSDCVIDNLTGLMWARNPDTTGKTWQVALEYANSLTLCGHTDWRLPNRGELRSLNNYGQADSAAWLNTQGFSNVQPYYYWSSTSRTGDLDLAWLVDLLSGRVSEGGKDAPAFSTWPVRGISSFGDSDISVSAVDTPDPVKGGSTFNYIVIITNNGPNKAAGVILTDTLPSGTSFVAAKSTQGTCSQSLRTVTCNLGDLQNGAISAVIIDVIAPNRADTIRNTAKVSCVTTDPDTSNNTAQNTTVVRRR
jgi:uncharacterized repeat protein (TIGR01451 family)